jgi:hypothetical protein
VRVKPLKMSTTREQLDEMGWGKGLPEGEEPPAKKASAFVGSDVDATFPREALS